MSVHSAGWAVEVVGARLDLDDLQRELPTPFDPWVEDDETSGGTGLLLRSKSWDQLVDASSVLEQASRLLELISGAMPLIHADAKPLALGKIVRFDDKGLRHIIIVPSAALALSGGRARAVSSVVGSESVTPTETQLQKWFKAAEINDLQAEFFTHLGRANGWFDLYKAMELLRKLAGGETALEAALGSDWGSFKKMRRTANFHRHAPGMVNPLPSSPPTLNETRAFLLRVSPTFLS